MKNKIVIYSGIGENKEKFELYNFSSVKHVFVNDRSYIRVDCDGRFYHFQTTISVISSIEIYK